MNNKLFKRISALALTAVMGVGASEAVIADVVKVDLDDFVNNSRKYKQNYTYVDISSVTNRQFTDEVAGDGKGGWADQGAVNDMSCFKEFGLQTFKGLNFNIINPKENDGTSVIVLRGIEDQSCPQEVTIPVDNVKAKGAYFLTACPWSNNTEEVGTITIVYSDGTEEPINMKAGDTCFNWWGTHQNDKAVSVWSGNNESSVVNLAALPYEIQNSDKEIKEIKAKTHGGKSDPYLVIVGITLTDTTPYLPLEQIPDIGNPDTSTWFPVEPLIDADLRKGSVLDMSADLEKPSGKHGHATAVGELLVFEDGTETQLWGANVASNNMFMTHEDAEANAKMLASMGFNCVRFHITTININSLHGIARTSTHSRRAGYIGTDNMEKLGYFLNELKKNGLYYGFDMTFPNLYMDNDMKYFDKITNTHAVEWFAPEVQEQHDRLAKQFLTWENPYTGCSIANDPSAVWLAFCNECTIFRRDDVSENVIGPYYSDMLRDQYNEWLRKKYPSRAALEYAWYDPKSDQKALEPHENQFEDTVEIYGTSGQKTLNSKRYRDNLEFMGDLERKAYRSFIDKIREYAPKLLIQGSTLCLEWSGAIYSAAKEGDFMSVQGYWYLPSGNGENMRPGTKIERPISSLEKSTNGTLGFLGNFTGRHVYGKVFFQTEWDASQPSPWRCEQYLSEATIAGMQDWNPMWFAWQSIYPSEAYREDASTYYMESGHQINNRPEAVAAMPALSKIVLRGDVTRAEKGYYQSRFYDGDPYEKSGAFRRTTNALYSIAGRARSAMDDVAFDPNYSDNDILKLVKYGEKTDKYISYTDEVMVDYNTRLFHLNTDRTQALGGYIGGHRVEFDDVIFEPETDHGVIYYTSLSNDSLTDTDTILLSYSSDARNDGQEMTEDGTTVVQGGQGPVWMKPVESKIIMKSKDTFEVYALDMITGQRKAKKPVMTDANGYPYFETEAADKTPHYEIVRTAKSNSGYTPNEITYLPEGVFDDIFTDLGKYEEHREKLERLTLEDYIKPIQADKFYPEQAMTRGEACEFIQKLFGMGSTDADQGLNDVQNGYKHYDAVSAAVYNGLASGDGNGNFRPDDAITKEEFFTMLYRGIQTTNMLRDENRGTVAPDLSNIADFAKEAVTVFTERGYCNEINSWDMKSPMNRAEATILGYRILWE